MRQRPHHLGRRLQLSGRGDHQGVAVAACAPGPARGPGRRGRTRNRRQPTLSSLALVTTTPMVVASALADAVRRRPARGGVAGPGSATARQAHRRRLPPAGPRRPGRRAVTTAEPRPPGRAGLRAPATCRWWRRPGADRPAERPAPGRGRSHAASPRPGPGRTEVAHPQVVKDHAHHDGNRTRGGRQADAAFLAPAHHPVARRQAERRTPGQHHRVHPSTVRPGPAAPTREFRAPRRGPRRTPPCRRAAGPPCTRSGRPGRSSGPTRTPGTSVINGAPSSDGR